MNRRPACPTCRKLVSGADDNPWRPFCSERCRLIDLGGWMNGSRRFPSTEAAPDLPPPEDPDTRH